MISFNSDSQRDNNPLYQSETSSQMLANNQDSRSFLQDSARYTTVSGSKQASSRRKKESKSKETRDDEDQSTPTFERAGVRNSGEQEKLDDSIEYEMRLSEKQMDQQYFPG